ncbi:MAG: C13 family peptidase [Polynucleobacter sp.]|nr:C13 family peptidase [Polynucleobacter sp.]
MNAATDVFVYYSGHGLPAADGQSLYLLPQLADRDLIEETAIAQSKINTAIQALKPKSVTILLDSCYSGAGRTAQALLAKACLIAIKSTA